MKPFARTARPRPLSADFEKYTDGDAELKNDLVILMIQNLRELQEALVAASHQKMPEIFVRAVHKIKTTIIILDDQDLDHYILRLSRPETFVHGDGEARVAGLMELCDELIASLQHESRNG